MKQLNTYIKSLLLSILLVATVNTNAQQIVKVRDWGTRIGVGFEHDYIKPYTLNFQQELRLDNNSTQIDSYLTEASLSYEISKNFKLGTNIRYTGNKKKDGFFYHDFRNDYNLTFKIKISEKVKFRYRLQYQKTYANLMTFDQHHYDPGGNKTHFRNKFELSHKSKKKHNLYISTEVFRAYELLRRPIFSKMRINLGDKYDFKKGQFNFGLSYERDWSDSVPTNFFFAKIYYTFEHEQK